MPSYKPAIKFLLILLFIIPLWTPGVTPAEAAIYLQAGQVTAENTKSDTDPPSEEPYIVIDTKTKTLSLYINNKLYKNFPVAIGKPETPTPVGEWEIEYKARNWGDGFGSRWMGLNVPWGLYGIHGTDKPWSIGGCESHGCVRMFNEDVEQLYDQVKKKTRVIITGELFSPFYEERRVLHEGIRGSDVMLLQLKLKEQGYLQGEIDGYYGLGTEQAVKQFQRDRSFESTGQVDADIYAAVGL